MALDNNKGRPAHDRTAIIEELKHRYPNGSEFTSADELFAANPDLLPKLKTLKNTAKESFGMPLGKYLNSIGLIGNREARIIPIETRKQRLFAKIDEVYPTKIIYRLKQDNYTLYKTAAELAAVENVRNVETFLAQNGYSFKKDEREKINLMGEPITAVRTDKEKGVLETSLEETERILKYIEILQDRYRRRREKPATLRKLSNENKDLPILEINKFIKDVLGEQKVEQYYLKKGILRPMDLETQEYTYCSVYILELDITEKYLLGEKNISIGDFVYVEYENEELIGEVKEIKTTTVLGKRLNTILRKTQVDLNEFSSNTADKSDQAMNEIFKMEKIKQIPRKKELIHFGEPFSKPLVGERGFFGTVFRGMEKDINCAMELCDRYGICASLEKTEFYGVFQLLIQRDADSVIREIMEKIPALKMVTFFAWWDGSCGSYYSPSGYSYITTICANLLVPKNEDEPWIYWRRADESYIENVEAFFENEDFGWEEVFYEYNFSEKDWNEINYITEKDGSLYRLNGYLNL